MCKYCEQKSKKSNSENAIEKKVKTKARSDDVVEIVVSDKNGKSKQLQKNRSPAAAAAAAAAKSKNKKSKKKSNCGCNGNNNNDDDINEEEEEEINQKHNCCGNNSDDDDDDDDDNDDDCSHETPWIEACDILNSSYTFNALYSIASFTTTEGDDPVDITPIFSVPDSIQWLQCVQKILGCGRVPLLDTLLAALPDTITVRFDPPSIVGSITNIAKTLINNILFCCGLVASENVKVAGCCPDFSCAGGLISTGPYTGPCCYTPSGPVNTCGTYVGCAGGKCSTGNIIGTAADDDATTAGLFARAGAVVRRPNAGFAYTAAPAAAARGQTRVLKTNSRPARRLRGFSSVRSRSFNHHNLRR